MGSRSALERDRYKVTPKFLVLKLAARNWFIYAGSLAGVSDLPVLISADGGFRGKKKSADGPLSVDMRNLFYAHSYCHFFSCYVDPKKLSPVWQSF
jgi:hypothetical protein